MLATITPTPQTNFAEAVAERARRVRTRKILNYYPDEGPLRRELYPKHIRFLNAGLTENIRAAIAANRTGKTEGMGGYELALHLTGMYPAFWIGRRFEKPISAWACGDTGKTVRDILQIKLLGPFGAMGTGLIPGDKIIGRPLSKQGVPEAVELVKVAHEFGGASTLAFKSYDQGRESFQGTEQDVILLDEEPPLDIYTECLMRTMPTGSFKGGIVMATFTPLSGMTPLIKHMREQKVWEVNVTWDDVPHLTKEDKAKMYSDMPEHQRDARSKGIPKSGYGLIYTEPESGIVVSPFAIPEHWPQLGGLDFGSDHPTAAAKLAFDLDTNTVYVTAARRQRKMSPDVFHLQVKTWPEWMQYAWPHDGHADGVKFGRDDTKQLHEIYKEAGFKMLKEHATFASGSLSVEAGVMEIQQRERNGQFKVFSSCDIYLEERRGYQRKEDGSINKEVDDVLCAARYGYMMRRFAKTKPKDVARKTMPTTAIGDRRIGY